MTTLINIDNGGTLTDICVWDGQGFTFTKTLTTPHDLSECLFSGIEKVSESLYGQADLAVGSTPAWVRACEQVRQVLTENQPAVVIGESGSGKFTLVAEIFHDAFPDARSVSIDACQIVDEGDTDVDLSLIHI